MSFVANFIRFLALQKFWKSVKIWQSYREFKGGNFFETQCIYICSFFWQLPPEPALTSAGPWQGSEAMASAEREPITGVCRQSPQRGFKDRALGGGQEGLPFVFCVSKGSRKFAPLLKKGKYNAAADCLSGTAS